MYRWKNRLLEYDKRELVKLMLTDVLSNDVFTNCANVHHEGLGNYLKHAKLSLWIVTLEGGTN